MPKIKISPISVFWITFLIISKANLLFQAAIAVLIHELGHICAARLLKIKISSFELSILGARIQTVGEISYGAEFFFALGGPLSGIITFAVLYQISLTESLSQNTAKLLLNVATVSLALAIFNLLPLPTLDGSRMINCLLGHLLPIEKAEMSSRVIGFFSLFALWLLSVYIILKTDAGIAMLVFCSIFFAKTFVFDEKKRDF